MTDFGSRKPAALLNTYENRNGQKMKPRNKAMLKAYEAIYEDGRLEWLDEQPKAGRHRVLVTMLDKDADRLPHALLPSPEEVQRILDETQHLRSPKKTPEEIQQVLDQVWGAWDRGKTLEEIDAEIEAMRAEWDRPWDDPDWKPEL